MSMVRSREASSQSRWSNLLQAHSWSRCKGRRCAATKSRFRHVGLEFAADLQPLARAEVQHRNLGTERILRSMNASRTMPSKEKRRQLLLTRLRSAFALFCCAVFFWIGLTTRFGQPAKHIQSNAVSSLRGSTQRKASDPLAFKALPQTTLATEKSTTTTEKPTTFTSVSEPTDERKLVGRDMPSDRVHTFYYPWRVANFCLSTPSTL